MTALDPDMQDLGMPGAPDALAGLFMGAAVD